MQEKHLFEYAVVRVVPRVEREEFLNAGVIVYCSGLKFLDVLYQLNADRLGACCSEIDLKELENNFLSMKNICAAKADAGPIARLDTASRFRWITATRSTVVQCSKVHSGLCDSASHTLQRLFEQLVL